MNETPLIYVAGPYSANKIHNEQHHIDQAEAVSIKLIKNGFHVITPHKNTAGYEKYEDENITFETWIAMDLNILKRCDAIYLINGWRKSKGASIEAKYAIKKNMLTIFESYYPASHFTLEKYYDIMDKNKKYNNM